MRGIREPSIIAHRGVPGHRLEHTRGSYELAIEQGADFIEPDVVSTRDGVLVVRHENEIGGTTDVAERPEFADRRCTKSVDGREHTGWFTEDFTLEELRSLRVRERLSELRPGNTALDGSEVVLTFAEVLEIAATENARRGPDGPLVGVYPETKHPTYFRRLGLELEQRLLDDLESADANRPGAAVPVVIQSMETNLRWFADHTPLPLMQLMPTRGAPFDLRAAGSPTTYEDMASAEGLAEVARYAQGIGPHKDRVISRDADDRLATETTLVRDAHAAGLFVHLWTLRDENEFLPADLRSSDDRAARGDAITECLRFLEAGVDGVFTDFTATAVAARDRWAASR